MFSFLRNKRVKLSLSTKNLKATLLFIDSPKHDSIHRGKMEQILFAYNFTPQPHRFRQSIKSLKEFKQRILRQQFCL